MKKIPVGNLFAIVDDEDYNFLSQFKWFPQTNPTKQTTYAILSGANQKGHKLSSKLMHKIITGFTQTDHVDGNGLNNRRSNLRKASNSQNIANRPAYKTKKTSKYKGVYPSPCKGRWRARTYIDGRTINIGSFATEVEAALAYDEVARTRFGDYAKLNIPDNREKK